MFGAGFAGMKKQPGFIELQTKHPYVSNLIITFLGLTLKAQIEFKDSY